VETAEQNWAGNEQFLVCRMNNARSYGLVVAPGTRPAHQPRSEPIMFNTARIARTSSIARRAVSVTLAGAALALAAPVAAQAAQGASVVVTAGSTICVKQNANYQYRATVNGGSPVGSSLTRGGVLVAFAFPTPSVAYEGRTSYGTFPGPGVYKLCVTNSGISNTRVTLSLLTDAEF
jgi:hypothetical protein